MAGDTVLKKTLLLSAILTSVFDEKDVTEEQIEEMLQGDVLSELMNELGEAMPNLKRVLIDERDAFLTQKMRESEGRRIVAVVGAGHLAGIKKALTEQHDIDLEANQHHPSGVAGVEVGRLGIPVAIVGSIAYIGWSKGPEAAGDNAMYWILANGIPCALGAILALAHPFTIVAAFVSAPTHEPHSRDWCGVCDRIRSSVGAPPVVKEFQTVGEDIGVLKKWWDNKLLKVFLAFLLPGSGACSAPSSASPRSSVTSSNEPHLHRFHRVRGLSRRRRRRVALRQPARAHQRDYFLAGRSLTWWLIGVSLIASNISTEHFVGMAGSAFGRVGLAIASYEWMAAVTLVIVGMGAVAAIPSLRDLHHAGVSRVSATTRTHGIGDGAVYLMIAYVVVALATVLYSGAIGLDLDLRPTRRCSWSGSGSDSCRPPGVAVAHRGSIWLIGHHRLRLYDLRRTQGRGVVRFDPRLSAPARRRSSSSFIGFSASSEAGAGVAAGDENASCSTRTPTSFIRCFRGTTPTSRGLPSSWAGCGFRTCSTGE